jgi:RNA polymerase sigma factor (sigma-70 family)
MNMTPDNELLRRYANTRSEEAFAELVRRHVNLVYSAALRQVSGDAHHAQDAAQMVFTDLARKALLLSRRESLTGWLYTSAHFAAAKITRTESRRRGREEKFMREPSRNTSPQADWEKLRPTLDSAMHELKEADREAVLLRYFENRPFAEVGAKLCLSEIAARKRVERAVEKLRALLARRGITTGAALVSVISANAVQPAPGYLAGALATASLTGAGSGAISFFQTMNMAKLKLGLGALATAGVIAALVVQLHAQRTLRAENESLSGQITQLKADNTELSNQISANASSVALQRDQSEELLKLRAEVTQLRAMKSAPTAAASPATNSPPAMKDAEINVNVQFVSLPTRTMPSFGAGWTAAGPDTSVLSEQQFAVVRAALRNNDVSLINESQVTTLSGREATLQAIHSIPVAGTNADIGAMVDMLPYFSSDSSMFTLNLAAKLNQLTGDPSNPGLVSTQMSNQVSVAPGQTVVLKGEIPAGAWVPRTKDNAVVMIAPDGPTELLIFVTPNLTDGKSEEGQASANPAWREMARQKMTIAKQGVLALIMSEADNHGQFPANFSELSHYIDDDSRMNEIEANFEFINPGSITNVAQPANTILLKEKEPWQGGDGSWMKTYGFADGHSEVHKEPNGNFDEFEKEHSLAASGQ